jgi:hypothetical protein
MNDKLGTTLERVRDQMTDPDVPVGGEDDSTTKGNEMSDEKKPRKRKTKVVETAAKSNGKKPAKAAKSKDDADGMVTLAMLAKELKIEPRAARITLRKAEVENPGRWAWKDGSGELTKIRKLLAAE